MYVRMIAAQVPPFHPRGVAPLPMSVLMGVQVQPGFEDALVLVDRERSRVVLLFLWHSKEAMDTYEASPAYQAQQEELARYFTGPAVSEAYDAPFSFKQVTAVSHTALITGVDLSQPQQPVVSPAEQPSPGGQQQGGYFSWAPLGRDRSQEPRPHAEELVRVIPIAQKQTRDETTVELLSLESYTDGFILQARLWVANPPLMTAAQHSHPLIRNVFATDERGTRYRGIPKGSTGNQWGWRFTFAFAPALTPNTRELRLTLPELRWWQVKQSATEAEKPDIEIQAGPWEFTIALPGSE